MHKNAAFMRVSGVSELLTSSSKIPQFYALTNNFFLSFAVVSPYCWISFCHLLRRNFGHKKRASKTSKPQYSSTLSATAIDKRIPMVVTCQVNITPFISPIICMDYLLVPPSVYLIQLLLIPNIDPYLHPSKQYILLF